LSSSPKRSRLRNGGGGGGGGRLQWPRRISDHLDRTFFHQGEQEDKEGASEEDARASLLPPPLSVALRSWLRDVTQDSRRRRERWQAAWERAASLVADMAALMGQELGDDEELEEALIVSTQMDEGVAK